MKSPLRIVILALAFFGAQLSAWAETVITQNTTVNEGDSTLTGQDVVVRGATLTLNGTQQLNSLKLENNAVLTHSPTTATQEFAIRVKVTGAVIVDATSRIDVSGKGYLQGYTKGATGPTTTGASTHVGGGSYGGYGGWYDGTNGRNEVYGDFRDPNELGSGSGMYQNYGGSGGGLVRIEADSLSLDGSIVANAPTATYQAGSGGGVNIRVRELKYAAAVGTIAADGGYTGSYSGGGGGRISVRYETGNFTMDKVHAWGGYGGSYRGGAGTVYVEKSNSKPYLKLDNNGLDGDYDTPLWFGVRADLSDDPVEWAVDLVVQKAAEMRVDSRLVLKTSNLPITSGGRLTVGAWEGENLEVSGGNSYLLTDKVTASGTIKVLSGGIIYSQATTATEEHSLLLKAQSVIIDATSRIDVTGRGYLQGYTKRATGPTTAGASTHVGGGSYGGYGGWYDGTNGRNEVYGDFRDPNELGSGSGMYQNYGGSGGGLVRLEADSLSLDGSIVANAPTATYQAGSGGGVNIRVRELKYAAAVGTIAADGGYTGSYSGGGGGRISVRYETGNFTMDKVHAWGGYGGNYRGGAGTVFIQQIGVDRFGHLRLDNNNASSAQNTPIFKKIGSGTITSVDGATRTVGLSGVLLPISYKSGMLSDARNSYIQPDITQSLVQQILTHTSQSVTFPIDAANMNAIQVGKNYRGVVPLDSLRVANSAVLDSKESILLKTGTLYEVNNGRALGDIHYFDEIVAGQKESLSAVASIGQIQFSSHSLSETTLFGSKQLFRGTKTAGTGVWVNGVMIIPPSLSTYFEFEYVFPRSGHYVMNFELRDSAGTSGGAYRMEFDVLDSKGVNTMPFRYARPDTPVTIWGNINHGDPLAQAVNYSWQLIYDQDQVAVTFDNAALQNGTVSTATKSLELPARFALKPGFTRAEVKAVLTVNDSGISYSSATSLLVLSMQDAASDTSAKALDIDRKIAIEKGLYFLYKTQLSNGAWDAGSSSYTGQAYADMATAGVGLWAFCNNGHTPDKNPKQDIYQPGVVRSINYIAQGSSAVNMNVTPYGNPDFNNNGKGVIVGGASSHSGYVQGICLAGLTSTGTPSRMLEVPGLGTVTLQDLVQDGAEYLAYEAGINRGGWGYSLNANHDMSVMSWNYLGIEGAMKMGCQIDPWVRTACEEGITLHAYPDGRFYYGPASGHLSAATTGAGLTGLSMLALDGRKSGIDVGAFKVRTSKQVNYLQNPMNLDFDNNPNSFYAAWTNTRALRMANIENLNWQSRIFDWQRNTDVSLFPYKGSWPNAISKQRADGGWTITGYEGDIIGTAFAVLCLTEGVLGEVKVVKDVEIAAKLSEVEASTLLSSSISHNGRLETRADGKYVVWTLGDIPEGQSYELSYEQKVTNLVAGEKRPMQEGVSAKYKTSNSLARELALPGLVLQVKNSLYGISVVADKANYASGEIAQLRSDYFLPLGQQFQSLQTPQAGTLVFGQAGQTGVEWKAVTYTLTNPQDFPAGSTPVRYRVRTGLTQDALAAANYSDWYTADKQLLTINPASLLGLELELTPNAQGTKPVLDELTLHFNQGEARLVMSLESPDAKTVEILNQPIFSSDYGQSLNRSVDWSSGNQPEGSYKVRAEIRLNGQTQVISQQPFSVNGAPDYRFGGSITADRLSYFGNETVALTSQVFNNHPELVLPETTVQVSLLDAVGTLLQSFPYTLPKVDAGDKPARSFSWFTGAQKPGSYQLRQEVKLKSGQTQTSTSSFTINSDASIGNVLSGTVAIAPKTLDPIDNAAISWSVSHRGNTALSAVRARLLVKAKDSPLAAPLWTRELTNFPLEVGGRHSDGLSGALFNGLPGGQYLLVLEAAIGEGEFEAVALSGFTLLSNELPPVTTDDYAHKDAWFNQDALVHLSATDDRSGVEQTSYTIEGATVIGNTFTVSREGETIVTYRSVDKAGKVETDKQLKILLDKTLPIFTCDYANFAWRNQALTMNFGATDALSDIAEFYYTLGTSTDKLSGTSVTLSTEGSHRVVLHASDKAGNIASKEYEVRIDLTAPVSSDTYAHKGQWMKDAQTFALTATDAASGVASTHFSVNGGSEQTGTSVTVAAEGKTTVSYYSVDAAGNKEAAKTLEVWIDLTAPVISTDYAGGANWQGQATTVKLSAVDAGSGLAKLSYSLDGGSVVDGNEVVLSEGIHQLKVTALDHAGNSSSLDVEVKVDLTAPVSSDTYAHKGQWMKEAQNLTLTATDAASGVASTHFSVNGGSEQTGTSVTVSAEGKTTVSYYSVDAAGNKEATKTLEVWIDLTAPVISTDYAGGANWQGQATTVKLNAVDAGSGVASLSYSLDGSAAVAGNEVVVTEGIHQLKVFALDHAGNSSSLDVEVKVDLTAPVSSDTYAHKGQWMKEAQTFALTATDAASGVASTHFSVNGGSEQTGTSVTVAAEGKTTVSYYSVDAAGNKEAAKTLEVWIDLTAPVISTDYAGGANWQGQATTVKLNAIDTGSGLAKLSYSVDGGTVVEGNEVVVTEGIHQLKVFALDHAGNSSSLDVEVKVDLTAPVSSDTYAHKGQWMKEAQNLTLTATDAASGVASTHFSVNGGSEQTGTSVTVSAEGKTTVSYYSVDAAGNKEATKTLEVWIDLTAPVISTDYAGGANWQGQATTVKLSAVDAGSGLASLSYSLDGSAAVAGNEVVLTEGTHLLKVFALDQAGNSSSLDVEVKVDLTAPVTTHNFASAGTWLKDAQTFTLAATDNASGVASTHFTVNGGSEQTGTSVTVAAEGKTTVSYYSVDAAGNKEAAKTLEVWIDLTAPVISTDYAGGANWQGQATTVKLSAIDTVSGLAKLSYLIDGGAEVVGNEVVLAEGTHQLKVFALDQAGNSSSLDVAVKVDLTAPVTSSTYAHAGTWMPSAQTLTLAATDAGSGVAATYFKVGAGSEQTGTSVTVAAEGKTVVSYYSVDLAGNKEVAKTLEVWIDKTAPVTTSNYASSGIWMTSTQTFTLAAADAGSGVAATYFKVGSGTEQTGNTVSVSAEGKTVVSYYSVDAAGNREVAKTLEVWIDKTAPVTSDNYASKGVTVNAAQTITLSAIDAASGVATTYYTLNGGTAQTGSSFTVTASGTTVVSYWSVDKAGNIEAAKTFNVVIAVSDTGISGTTGVNPNNSDKNNEFTYVSAAGQKIVLATLKPLTADAKQVIFRAKNGDSLMVNGQKVTLSNKLYTITAATGTFHFEIKAGNNGQGQYSLTLSPGTATGVTVK